MRTLVFWPALLVSLGLSLAMATIPQRDIGWAAMTLLAWTAPLALAWTRWVRRPARWIARIAAAAGLVMLLTVVQGWSAQTDVFIRYSECRPPRAKTFWPLVFLWACGLGLMAFTLWGSVAGWRATRAWRTAAWWLAALAWTAACVFVLSRNLVPGVLGASLVGLAKVAGAIAGVFALIAIPLFWGSRFERRTARQASEDFARIDTAGRRRLLELIDTTARKGEFRLMYRPADAQAPADPIARIGGDPLAAPGDTWPADDAGNPALFLLQVPLEGIAHPAWSNRVLCVFISDHDLIARCHLRTDAPASSAPPGPSPDPGLHARTMIPLLVTMSAPPSPSLEPMALAPLAIPLNDASPDNDDGDESGGEWPDTQWFFARMPELRAALSHAGAHPDRLLGMLLTGDTHGQLYAAAGQIVVGGRPALLQGPHEARCPECGQPMRFLMQFGDVTEDFALGDAGTGYVYGCDAHPHRLEAYSDCY